MLYAWGSLYHENKRVTELLCGSPCIVVAKKVPIRSGRSCRPSHNYSTPTTTPGFSHHTTLHSLIPASSKVARFLLRTPLHFCCFSISINQPVVTDLLSFQRPLYQLLSRLRVTTPPALSTPRTVFSNLNDLNLTNSKHPLRTPMGRSSVG